MLTFILKKISFFKDWFAEKLNLVVAKNFYEIFGLDGFKKYLVNTGWMFLGQFFSLLVAFFISAWLARYLGPKNYGIFSYSIAFVGLFSSIVSLGADAILSKELVNKPEKRDELLGTAFGLKIIGALSAIFLVIIFSFIFVKDEFSRRLIITYSFVFAFDPINTIAVFFQSQVKAKINFQIKILVLTLSTFLKVIMILTLGGIIWLTLIFVFEAFLNNFFALIFYKKSGLKILDWKFNKQLAKQILTGSIFLMLASVANLIFLRIDQVMIGYMLSVKEVGLYAVAVKLVEVWYFVPVIICSSLFPAIINSKKINKIVYYKRLKMFFVLLFVVGLVISAFSAVVAPFIVKVLFGTQYLLSIPIVQIYTWSGIGLFLGWGIYHYSLSENKLKDVFYFYFLSMLLNITLNFILILRFGLTGAAWATLISYSLGPCIFFILKYQTNFYNKTV